MLICRPGNVCLPRAASKALVLLMDRAAPHALPGPGSSKKTRMIDEQARHDPAPRRSHKARNCPRIHRAAESGWRAATPFEQPGATPTDATIRRGRWHQTPACSQRRHPRQASVHRHGPVKRPAAPFSLQGSLPEGSASPAAIWVIALRSTQFASAVAVSTIKPHCRLSK